MKCEKCLDKNGCPLYRGENTDTCWYEVIRKEKNKKVLDNHRKMCYNQDRNEGREAKPERVRPTRVRKTSTIKSSTARSSVVAVYKCEPDV